MHFPKSFLFYNVFFVFLVNIDYSETEDPIFGELQGAESDYSASESDEVCISS